MPRTSRSPTRTSATSRTPVQDSQAIAGWNTPGPITIRNNYLEAAGENILFGGAQINIPNVVPSDILVEDNVLTKDPQWRGTSWTVKNLFELKNARRVLVRRNMMEYNWSGAQAGFAVVLTPRNSSGRTPWVVIEDVEFSCNVIRSAASVFNILGHDDTARSGQLARLLITRQPGLRRPRRPLGRHGDVRADRRRAARHHDRSQHGAAHRQHRALLLRQLHQRQRREGDGWADRWLRVHQQHGQAQRLRDLRQRQEHRHCQPGVLRARIRGAPECARQRQVGGVALSARQLSSRPSRISPQGSWTLPRATTGWSRRARISTPVRTGRTSGASSINRSSPVRAGGNRSELGQAVNRTVPRAARGGEPCRGGAPADGRVEKRRLRPDGLRARSSVSCAVARLRSPLYWLTPITRVGGRPAPTRLSAAEWRGTDCGTVRAHSRSLRCSESGWPWPWSEPTRGVPRPRSGRASTPSTGPSRNARGAIPRVDFRPCDP